MNIAIRYASSARDHSGYGSAARAFIAALYVSGVDITTETISHVRERTDFGWQGKLNDSLEGRNIPYKVKIIHLTPDTYPKYIEKGKYHIGRLAWETDKLPKEWIDPINKMGEIWTSSPNMIELFKQSGIKVPMYWFPEPISIHDADKDWGRFQVPYHEGILFYSIFQWIERKNPKALVQSYWKAFEGKDDVSLLLKTYRITYSDQEFELIKDDIREWKRQQPQSHYPRLLLCRQLLTQDQIMKLHQTADCYVSGHSGEGWCRPVQEALLMGNPVISTARGGIYEFLKDDMYFPIDSTYEQVTPQPFIPWYTADQKWARINQDQFIQTMQYVYKNLDLARAKGIIAKNYIKDEFGYHKIGKAMLERLTAIYKGL